MSLLCFLFIFQNCFADSENIIVDCTINSDGLEQALVDKIFVTTVDIQADFKIDQDELLYLIDITPPTYLKIQDLKRVLFYLRKKEAFSKIELCYNMAEQKLTFNLEGLFVLANLSLHGSMIGKEKYKHSYILEVGEYFDAKKHTYSVKKIKEKLYHAGCFQAEVTDHVIYDPLTKLVKVDLFLHKGPQFLIGDCAFDVQPADKLAKQDLQIIQEKLAKLFLKKFFSIKYSKKFIDTAIADLKHDFTKLGFHQVAIDYQEVIDYQYRQVNLQFQITCAEKKELIFWGNHFFTKENFLENIFMYGKYCWHFPGAILSDEIMGMYKSKGFWDAKVTVQEEENKTYFMIDEGKRAFIQDIEIKDNFYIATQQIKTVFGKLVEQKPFDREFFSQALVSIKQLYQQQGFWDIKVVKEDFTLLKVAIEHHDMTTYKATLTLDEGAVRKLKSVQIVGYPQLSDLGPFVQFSKLTQAVPFNYFWLMEQKSWLLQYFKEQGYNKVTVDYQMHDTADGIDLVWNVHVATDQVQFGKFLICGNSQVPFKYLQRELAMESGQLWNRKKIDQSLANLRSLELFEMVHIYSHKHVDDDGQIPVGIKLIAADKYEVRTRIGCQQVGKDFALQQGFSYKVGGTAIVNNPFKIGDRAILEADFTRFYENFSLQYLMPWLFTRPIRSQIKLYDNHYLQPLFIGSDVSIYNAFQQGLLFGLQEKYETVNLGMSVGLEFKGIAQANIEDIAASIDFDPLLLEKKFAYFFAQPSLMWTNVDNIVNPRSGSNALVSLLAMADLQSQTSLFKFLCEYALYVPCTVRTIFVVRTRVGHIFNQEYVNILPIDRFYLGGANTIRGYDRDYCPPLGLLRKPVYAPHVGLPPAADNLWRYVCQGGRTMFNCNFEARFPIYYEFQGAVFLDTGVLIKDSVQEVPDNFLAGAGFGFRYNTPIGPIRFDLSFKLDRKYPEFESPYVWYLTLGQAF